MIDRYGAAPVPVASGPRAVLVLVRVLVDVTRDVYVVVAKVDDVAGGAYGAGRTMLRVDRGSSGFVGVVDPATGVEVLVAGPEDVVGGGGGGGRNVDHAIAIAVGMVGCSDGGDVGCDGLETRLCSACSMSFRRCSTAWMKARMLPGRSESPDWMSWMSSRAALPAVMTGGDGVVRDGAATLGTTSWRGCLWELWRWTWRAPAAAVRRARSPVYAVIMFVTGVIFLGDETVFGSFFE